MPSSRTLLVLAVVIALVPTARAPGQDPAIALDPPPADSFVLDRAGLLDETQRGELEAIGRALLADRATPLVVVTIPSMREHWPYGDIRIETFAHLLFDQWAIGIAERDGQPWNTGILLLVSQGDRRARIQLGAGWGRAKDAACTQIMDRTIVPRFKRGRFGEGIVEGARALDRMARGDAPSSGGATRAPSVPGAGVVPPTRFRSTTPSRPHASGGGASPVRHGGGLGVVTAVGCFGLIMVLIAIGAVLRKNFGPGRAHLPIEPFGAHDDDDPDRDGRSGRRSDGFWSGFLAGQWLNAGRRGGDDHFGGGGFGGGFGGGGFGGGGGFSGGGSTGGGGFSGGGGASGGW